MKDISHIALSVLFGLCALGAAFVLLPAVHMAQDYRSTGQCAKQVPTNFACEDGVLVTRKEYLYYAGPKIARLVPTGKELDAFYDFTQYSRTDDLLHIFRKSLGIGLVSTLAAVLVLTRKRLRVKNP